MKIPKILLLVMPIGVWFLATTSRAENPADLQDVGLFEHSDEPERLPPITNQTSVDPDLAGVGSVALVTFETTDSDEGTQIKETCPPHFPRPRRAKHCCRATCCSQLCDGNGKQLGRRCGKTCVTDGFMIPSTWHAWTANSCPSWIEPYLDRILVGYDSDISELVEQDHSHEHEIPDQHDMPGSLEGFEPWWQSKVIADQRNSDISMPITLDSLILSALRHSHSIRAESNVPLITEKTIIEAKAEFDTTTFMESKFTKTSEPVGNLLTTGPGRGRFRNSIWDYEAGIRKHTYGGGSFEFAQRFGYEDSNSEFFDPTQQGTAKLALRFAQPLLYGAGQVYNTSLIVLAKIQTRIAWDEFVTQLQDHLIAVSDAYWELYLQRASLLQKQRHVDRAKDILAELQTRQTIDASVSQVVRARSAVAQRESELSRARSAILNAEARIRALINDPALSNANQTELVPREVPMNHSVPISTRDALISALQNRPEIDQSIQQLRSANVHVTVARNELLPMLDLVTETYVNGLRGESNVGGAWVDQFSVGEPSYSFGLEFEIPLHNRAARARFDRKKLQLRALVSRYKATVESLLAEVEVAAREVQTARDEMRGKYHAMMATEAELDYLSERWKLLPGDDRSASFLLEDILDVQDRFMIQEFEFARAQVSHARSLVFLKRATGTLLESEQVTIDYICDGGQKQMHLDKMPSDSEFEQAAIGYPDDSQTAPNFRDSPSATDLLPMPN